uniref:Uncharacterized protein n=1 Tax=Serratia marcescens TaxID=615 RepID=V5YVU5_SERMA|nr:hypothetical protein [Serratia marcescens]
MNLACDLFDFFRVNHGVSLSEFNSCRLV